MEKRHKVYISFLFLIMLIVALYFFSSWFSRTTGYFIEDEEEESGLAKCLTGKGVVLYGAKKCKDCGIQKDLFGNGFKDINYVECNGHPGICQQIEGVPAWNINGNMLYGVKSLAELKVLSGCG